MPQYAVAPVRKLQLMSSGVYSETLFCNGRLGTGHISKRWSGEGKGEGGAGGSMSPPQDAFASLLASWSEQCKQQEASMRLAG